MGSLIANQKDGELHTLRIINSHHNVQTTLEKKMLKSMETYSAVVKTFYTNAVPSLLTENIVFMKVFPKDDEDEPVTEWEVETHFLDAVPNHQLTIRRDSTHNILGLVHQISQFCVEVNKNIFLYGSDYGVNAAYHIAPVAGFTNNVAPDIHNEVTPNINGQAIHHISFSIDSNGRAIFRFSQEFLRQFYVELDENFAKMIGIEQYLWAGEGGLGNLVYAGDHNNSTLFRPTGAGPYFNHNIECTTVGGRGLDWKSNRSIFLADRRQTLVVEMSMPFSRTILSEDGTRKEKYRLAEFPIDNYIESKGTAQSTRGQVLAKVKTTDTLQGGLTDFTKGFSESHIIHFLPGDLTTVNTRLYIVYKSLTGEKVELPFELGYGFYDLEILFVKKVKNERGSKERVPTAS